MPGSQLSLKARSVLRPRTDRRRHGFRKHVVRFLRWAALGDTAVYAMAKRLANVIDVLFVLYRLSTSSTPEHRQVLRPLASAVRTGDSKLALAIARNGRQRPDRRAEKIVSHRYEFVWICNPKVASRSILRALMVVDPEATLLFHNTTEELISACPEVRRFFSFAFVRDPCERARSFVEDKLDSGPLSPNWVALRSYYGLRKGMSFAEYCRWLETPFGSDAFADKHFLSQHTQIEVDGRLPDYVGSYENLEENWRWVLGRLGVPYTELPYLNKRRAGTVYEDVDDDSLAILRRRYDHDFELVRRVGSRGLIRGAPR